mgnify:FL=1
MKKFYCLIITILTIASIQNIHAQNLPTIDYKRWHYGAFVGLNVMDFGIKDNPESNLRAEIKNWIPGFSVGLIGEMAFNRFFSLRLAPAFHMGQYNVTFYEGAITSDNQFKSDTIHGYKNTPSNIVRIPIYIRYSAVRLGDYKPYILAGGGMDIEWNIDKDPENPILFKRLDYFTEFGVGCTIYTEYLRFSIEAKYSIGFNNKLVSFDNRVGTPHEPLTSDADNINRALEAQSIQSLRSRIFSLVLNINI